MKPSSSRRLSVLLAPTGAQRYVAHSLVKVRCTPMANCGLFFANWHASYAHAQGAMIVEEVIEPDLSRSMTARFADLHIPKSSALIMRYLSIDNNSFLL